MRGVKETSGFPDNENFYHKPLRKTESIREIPTNY